LKLLALLTSRAVWISSLATTSAPLEKTPKGAGYTERYIKRFGTHPVLNSPFAHGAAYVIVDASSKSNLAPGLLCPYITKT